MILYKLRVQGGGENLSMNSHEVSGVVKDWSGAHYMYALYRDPVLDSVKHS